jgi:hypothetical protein
MTSKYIKFGLRADKNLVDLTNPQQALSNLLDDISSALDENGIKSGFTVADISATSGLRNTGLADFTNEDGQSTDLADLLGSLVEFTNLAGSTQVVQPVITLQDNISNFKSVLGNPPWINGGDGLVCNFIGSDRIKSSVTGAITGNSGTATTLGGLSSSQLFTTDITSGSFTPIIGPLDFWNNGVFSFTAKLHPQMQDTYGLVQWTGYLSSNYDQDWGSTGLFIIEEDTVDDGTENNWTQIKSVYATSATLSSVTFSAPSNDVVTADYSASSTNLNYPCIAMKFTVGSTTYEIITVDPKNKTFTVASSTSIQNGNISLSFELGADEVQSPILFTSQKRGSRVRVRYTHWYPDPGNGSAYREKTFRETNQNSERAPFSDYYKTFDRNQVFGPYTYKYFEDNKASPLNQTSTAKLSVLDTISLPIVPPGQLSDKIVGITGSNTSVTPTTITVRDNFGKISAPNFSGVVSGDWMVFKKANNSMYAFQIESISGQDEDGNTYAYVKDTLNADATFSIGDTQAVIFIKNVGLVGIFRGGYSSNTVQNLYRMSPVSLNPDPSSVVFPDQIMMSISSTGGTGLQPKRVFDASGASPRAITISDYLGNGGTINNSQYRIVAVYASRGLDDKSSYLQCNGVYGREVAGPVSGSNASGQNRVTLTTVTGISTGDFVQYSGIISGTNSTTVSSIDSSTNTITLTGPSSGNLLAELPAARTVVFVKSTNDPLTSNKEFCVIPLNTAPPFAGTELGLATPSANSNLEVEGLVFGKLQVVTPSANVNAIGTLPNNSGKYLKITHGGTTYKALAFKTGDS